MSVRKYENGERIASNETIQAIAATLDVDLYSLYSFDQASDALVDHINVRERIDTALGKLNDAGMEKAADVVEIIAEVPRYRATPPSDAPETAPEGE